MKQTTIPYIPALSKLYAELAKSSRGAAAENPDKTTAQAQTLLKETKQEIDISACTWRTAESDKPLGTVTAGLNIGYSGTILGLLYTIEGDELLVRYTQDWDRVCQDSCVECFISSESTYPAYVNLEFNPLGTCWAQIGPDRNHRERLSKAAVSTIFRRGSITTRAMDAGCLKGESRFRWEMLVMMPMQKVGILAQHEGAGYDADMLKGTRLRANFYTTGDDLQNPVYQSWCPIDTPSPDFHQPKYFGELVFG